MPGFQSWSDDKRIKGLVILVLILAAVALAAYSYYTYKQSRYMFGGMNTISVSGKGEVLAKPDIATFSFSADAENVDAVAAKDEAAKIMNDVVAYLKEAGVEEKDIKTSYYNLSQKYRWEEAARELCTQWGGCPPGRQILDGFQVNQTVTVKVRDTEKAGELISGVTGKGATNISSLEFTIDDDEALKAEARELAIKDAKENAEKLARELGVRLGRISSFNENGGGYPMPMYAKSAVMEMSDSSGGMAPSVPMGENMITTNVTIVYEIK